MRIAVVVTSLCLSCIALANASDAKAMVREATTIPAQPLDSALRMLAKNRGFHIVYLAGMVSTLRTEGANGELTRDEALAALLDGTGLGFRYLDEDTVTVLPIAAGPTSSNRSHDSAGPQLARAGAADTPPVKRSEEDPERKTTAEEIVVTGTNIRGRRNDTVPVTTITREDIDRSGHGTTSEVLASLPQNFTGGQEGASETGQLGVGSFRFLNTTFASGVNLRGLNSVGTLTLLNGRRLAPVAEGFVTDISTIPLTAIERIDIVSDGASAIYGSDAVSGVVNFILRDDYRGSETRVRYGRSTQGGVDEKRVSQTFGTAWNTGSVLIAGEGYWRSRLVASDRPDLITSAIRQPADLLPKQERLSGIVHARQRFGERTELTFDATASHTKREHVLGSISGTSYTPSSPKDTQYSLNLGAAFEPAGNWRFEFSGGLSTADTDSPQSTARYSDNAVTFSYLKLAGLSTVKSVDLLATGSAFYLPAGRLGFALGGGYREDEFKVESAIFTPANPLVPTVGSISPFASKARRDEFSVFAESYVPLVNSAMAVPLVKQFDLSLAARYDEYSDAGDTVNPKFGVVWRPFSDLALRSSYSTSFRAPNAREQNQQTIASRLVTVLFTAPSGAGTVPVVRLSGSQALRPEESENYTVGLTYQPHFAEGLSMDLNFFDISYTDRIQTPTFNRNALVDPSFASLIRTFSSDAEVTTFVNQLTAQGAQFQFSEGIATLNGIRYAFDQRLQNVASVDIRGLDVSLRQNFQVGQNDFLAKLDATYIDYILTTIVPSAPGFDAVDLFGSPVDLRARATLSWSRKPWSLSGAVNYVDSYFDNTGLTLFDVNSYTTVDMSAAVQVGELMGGGSVDGLSLRLSVVDLLDRSAPDMLRQGNGYKFDPNYIDPRGRFISLEMVMQW